jgi:hypothetical protein
LSAFRLRKRARKTGWPKTTYTGFSANSRIRPRLASSSKELTSGRVVSRHCLKDDAVEAGRAVARELKVEHTIHLSGGTIGEKNSYGNDPFPPQDSG